MITIDLKKLGIAPNDKILDIGCGEGRHTVMACQQNQTMCVGGDYEYENLVKTKEKLRYHQSMNDICCRSFNLSCMDISDMPFCNKSFDIVICSEVLEHIHDDKKAMSELVRILKPGKILAVSVPRFWPEKICWLLSDEYFDNNMGHVRIYKKDSLVKEIESFGLKNFHTHYAHSIHSPFWWLKCLVGPGKSDSKLVNLYHRLLVWDLMEKPRITAFIDRLLNPLLGKSVVLYFRKK